MPRAFLLTNRRYRTIGNSLSSDCDNGYDIYDVIRGDYEDLAAKEADENFEAPKVAEDDAVFEKHLPIQEAESRSFAARAILHLGLDVTSPSSDNDVINHSVTIPYSSRRQNIVDTASIPSVIPFPPRFNSRFPFYTPAHYATPYRAYDYRMHTLSADERTTHNLQRITPIDDAHAEYHALSAAADSAGSDDITPPTSPESSCPSDASDAFQCDICEKTYSTSSNLARHRQTHRSMDDKKARKCPHCEKVYVSMPAYSMHVRTHAQGCKCPYCGKNFSRPWLLQGHIRTHTGEKPFTCSICSKCFADKSNLRAHIQTHSTQKPFTCARCGKAFALKSYLYKHEESSCMRGQRGLLKKQRQRQRHLSIHGGTTDKTQCYEAYQLPTDQRTI